MLMEVMTPTEAADWLSKRVTGTLRTDSRCVQPGDGFLAWPGEAVDARVHVDDALANGAVVCLVEHTGVKAFGFATEHLATPIATCQHLKMKCAAIAAHYFHHPSTALKVVAVTGTNGKTSIAWWLALALSNLELSALIPSAFVGTLGIGVVPDVVSCGLTTPDPVTLQEALRHFVDAGIQVCAMEASSIGIEEHRLDATCIHTAIFTNLTQDHLDYHNTMTAYGQAKAKLFDWHGLRAAVVNVDDPFGAELAAGLLSRQRPGSNHLDLWTVSLNNPSDARLKAQAIEHSPQGVRFTVVEGKQCIELATQLMGLFNVTNLLCVIAAMRTLGVPLASAVQACARLTPVPGRMECVHPARQPVGQPVGQPLVVVDYAHTPDALAKALKALQPVAKQRGGQLWCVFGCGGNRDTSKRPLMGAMAAGHADRVVVTSDNPRSEAMDTIISQILLGLTGVPHVMVEPDRASAIAHTLAQAAAVDVVLIAGKGHENYQEIAGERLPFSDREQVQKVLAQRATTMMMTLSQMAEWLDSAQWVDTTTAGTAGLVIRRVHTDTRTIAPGDLFVAVRGQHFDALDFLQEARQKGAVAAIVQGDDAAQRLSQAGLPGFVVRDTRVALAQLATHYRRLLNVMMIAVTGSNGKTTVTQMIASILRAYLGDATLATLGNFNNDIGVPLTVLRLTAAHTMAVVELGMNHPHEIAAIAAIAQPTVALVNNAQREHLEFMQTVLAVAHENGSVIDALPADGVAVFPADDAFSSVWAHQAGAHRVMRFASVVHADADVYALQSTPSGTAWQTASQTAWQIVAATPQGELHYTLHVAGRHNVKNSLAAATCALAAQVPLEAIARGLSAFEPIKGRSRACQITYQGRTITLMYDTYNDNPDSVMAAIDVLADLPGPRLLVLGDMGEVGENSLELHAQSLHYAMQKNMEKVLVTGAGYALAAINFEAVGVCDDMAHLQAAVLAELPAVASMLVKGSRFMKMERVVEAVLQQGGASC